MKGKGCANCQRTGYRGRLGIYELMMMTSTIRELAFAGDVVARHSQGGRQLKG